jgi:hypothetical protein
MGLASSWLVHTDNRGVGLEVPKSPIAASAAILAGSEFTISRVECASGLMLMRQPKRKRALVPAPVKIKTPRVRVNLNSDAMFGAGFQNLFGYSLRNRPPQQLPSGHMAEDGGAGICDGAQDLLHGLGLLLEHFGYQRGIDRPSCCLTVL